MEIRGQPTSLLMDELWTMGPLKQIIQYQLPRREYLQMEGYKWNIHRSGHSQGLEGRTLMP